MCLRVSRTHIIFRPLSHPGGGGGGGGGVVGRYDSIISFGRISLTVRLDGNTRQSFTLVRIGPLQLKKEPTPGTVY